MLTKSLNHSTVISLCINKCRFIVEWPIQVLVSLMYCLGLWSVPNLIRDSINLQQFAECAWNGSEELPFWLNIVYYLIKYSFSGSLTHLLPYFSSNVPVMAEQYEITRRHPVEDGVELPTSSIDQRNHLKERD